jgi:hypothetical protein
MITPSFLVFAQSIRNLADQLDVLMPISDERLLSTKGLPQ